MSNISFESTLRPIFVAMAEPQFPEPTSATFSSGMVRGELRLLSFGKKCAISALDSVDKSLG